MNNAQLEAWYRRRLEVRSWLKRATIVLLFGGCFWLAERLQSQFDPLVVTISVLSLVVAAAAIIRLLQQDEESYLVAAAAALSVVTAVLFAASFNDYWILLRLISAFCLILILRGLIFWMPFQTVTRTNGGECDEVTVLREKLYVFDLLVFVFILEAVIWLGGGWTSISLWAIHMLVMRPFLTWMYLKVFFRASDF